MPTLAPLPPLPGSEHLGQLHHGKPDHRSESEPRGRRPGDDSDAIPTSSMPSPCGAFRGQRIHLDGGGFLGPRQRREHGVFTAGQTGTPLVESPHGSYLDRRCPAGQVRHLIRLPPRSRTVQLCEGMPSAERRSLLDHCLQISHNSLGPRPLSSIFQKVDI